MVAEVLKVGNLALYHIELLLNNLDPGVKSFLFLKMVVVLQLQTTVTITLSTKHLNSDTTSGPPNNT